MEAELKTTRLAHKQRLQRYKLLQENYDLALQQLATYEESSILTSKQKKQVIPRASAKSLQRENSKSVWNELEYYRREYEKLRKDRPQLTEELDELRVKASSGDTAIDEMNLQLLEFKNLLRLKEEELQDKVSHAQFYSLEKQLEIWKEKVYDSERKNLQLQEIYKDIVAKEKALQTEINLLNTELISSKQKCVPPVNDASMQTDNEGYNSKQLLDKMNEVIDVVQSDRLTVSQLESSIPSTTSKSVMSLSTQTTPVKVHFKRTEHSTQTDITSDSSTEKEDNSEKLKKKKQKKLKTETQRLLLLKSDITQENRSLKKRVFSLENQVNQLREAKNSLVKHVSHLQDDNEKLKMELVGTLQKLQGTREILQDRTSELERCSEELQGIVVKQQKEKKDSKIAASELKEMDSKLTIATTECSKLSVQIKTLTGENGMLSEKLKGYQDRISKLEKTVSQKKSYIDDLKEKYDQTKSKVDKETDTIGNLSKKLKATTDRESKNKAYIDNLKSKVEVLIADKSIILESVVALNIEVDNKTKLLQESQHLCRQAESAISEMEHAAYEQLQNQQHAYEEKQKVVKSRYEKCVAKINELKLAVKNFSEALLSEIHERRAGISQKQLEKAKKKHKKKQEVFLRNDKVHDIACSILNMTTSDLEDFMKDDLHIKPALPEYEDNDIREKLDVILKKEINFGKILTKFLLDLVQYYWSLTSQEMQLSS